MEKIEKKKKIKSQIKEQNKNKERHLQAKKYRTIIKNKIKKLSELWKKKTQIEPEELKKTTSEVQKMLDKAGQKRKIHPNRANKKKSWIQKMTNEKISKL